MIRRSRTSSPCGRHRVSYAPGRDLWTTLGVTSRLWTTRRPRSCTPEGGVVHPRGWSTGRMEISRVTRPAHTRLDRPDRRQVLVVDGANVVGSRPDGWWKDRSGAAARLHDRLVASPGLASQVVLVLEGRARGGVAEGVTGPVEVVHAGGEGDDTIVAEVAGAAAAGRVVAVVTADRGLAARVEDLGAIVRRPGWLLGPDRSGRVAATDRLDCLGSSAIGADFACPPPVLPNGAARKRSRSGERPRRVGIRGTETFGADNRNAGTRCR